MGVVGEGKLVVVAVRGHMVVDLRDGRGGALAGAALNSATNTSPIAAQNRALRSVRRVTMMTPTVAALEAPQRVPSSASSNLR